MAFFSGFFFFQSLFVWPKLIAAALVITAVAMLFFERRDAVRVAIATAAAAAGYLCHSGVIFTLFPMAVALLLLPRHRLAWRQLAVAAVVGALLLAPWLAYQKVFDPPATACCDSTSAS